MRHESSVYVNPPEIIRSLGRKISRGVAHMLLKQNNTACAVCVMCRSSNNEHFFTTLVEGEARITEIKDAGHAILAYFLVERASLAGCT